MRANNDRPITNLSPMSWLLALPLRATASPSRPMLALYTDGLALFGHQSSTDGRDPRSEFQRALTALGVTHRVAPSPQAKGKIERRFGTLSKTFASAPCLRENHSLCPCPRTALWRIDPSQSYHLPHHRLVSC